MKSLKNVLTSCNISFGNKTPKVFSACQYGKSHKLPFLYLSLELHTSLNLYILTSKGQPLHQLLQELDIS